VYHNILIASAALYLGETRIKVVINESALADWRSVYTFGMNCYLDIEGVGIKDKAQPILK